MEDDVRMFLTLLGLDFAGLYPHNLYDRDEIENLRAKFDAEGLGSVLEKEYKRLEEGD